MILVTYKSAAHPRYRVWDANVGDWPVTLPGLGGLVARNAARLARAAVAWPGWVRISSQRSLASRQRRARMPVAPCSVHLMPESFRRWPTIDLHPASTAPEPANMPSEVPVAHPVGVVLEVAQGCLEAGGLAAGQGEGPGGGGDRGDVAGAGVGEPGVQPVLLVVAEHELQQFRQVVQVLAGVEHAGDLGGLGEVLAGQVPDPRCAVAEGDELADVSGAGPRGPSGSRTRPPERRWPGTKRTAGRGPGGLPHPGRSG